MYLHFYKLNRYEYIQCSHLVGNKAEELFKHLVHVVIMTGRVVLDLTATAVERYRRAIAALACVVELPSEDLSRLSKALTRSPNPLQSFRLGLVLRKKSRL